MFPNINFHLLDMIFAFLRVCDISLRWWKSAFNPADFKTFFRLVFYFKSSTRSLFTGFQLSRNFFTGNILK